MRVRFLGCVNALEAEREATDVKSIKKMFFPARTTENLTKAETCKAHGGVRLTSSTAEPRVSCSYLQLLLFLCEKSSKHRQLRVALVEVANQARHVERAALLDTRHDRRAVDRRSQRGDGRARCSRRRGRHRLRVHHLARFYCF